MVIVGSSGSRASVPDSFSKKLLERPITREVLIGIKTRGLRRRVWYRALDRMERGLVDLTIRWMDKVRSGRLTETLVWANLWMEKTIGLRIVDLFCAGPSRGSIVPRTCFSLSV